MALILKKYKNLDKKQLIKRHKQKILFYKFALIIAILEAGALYYLINKYLYGR